MAQKLAMIIPKLFPMIFWKGSLSDYLGNFQLTNTCAFAAGSTSDRLWFSKASPFNAWRSDCGSRVRFRCQERGI